MWCDLLADCPAWWVLGEPLNDHTHVLLKAAWRGDIEHASPDAATVLKVMRDASRRQDKGTSGAINPLGPDEETHSAFKNIKGIVLWVRVSTRTLCIGLQPPFRNRVLTTGFVLIGFEHRRHTTHGIAAPFTGPDDQRASGYLLHEATHSINWLTFGFLAHRRAAEVRPPTAAWLYRLCHQHLSGTFLKTVAHSLQRNIN